MYSNFASIDNLDEFQAHLQQRVRDNATDADERFRLFQLMTIRGNWESADKQLRKALDNDPSSLPLIRSYQLIVAAEIQRGLAWSGQQPAPLAAGIEADWASQLASSLGDQCPAEQIANNLSAAPAIAGEIDVVVVGDETIETHEFEWIADGDCHLGPVLELIGQHGYAWLPMSSVREIELTAPQNGCDRIWMRADITLHGGERQRAVIPVRYVGDYGSQSDGLLLGRETCWQRVGDEQFDLFAGEGQRMWITDGGEYALLDTRAIRLRGATE